MMAQQVPLMLSRPAFEKARAYIFDHGRDLDRRLFEFHFNGGEAAAVLEALAHFQNPDGGFGHGLEPDIRTPASSAIATSQALDILREVGATGREKMVRQAVAYYLDSYDGEKQVWPIVPPQVEDAPHAPWWTFATLDFGGFVANPFASIAGHLNHYVDVTPPDFVAEVTAVARRRLREATISDAHDFYCYLNLAEGLPPAEQGQVKARLLETVPGLVATDPGAWSGYNMKPLDVVGAPDHFLAAAVDPQAIRANLDYLIGQQLPDGSWPLAWSWDFVDAAAWQQAEQDWKGHMAVANLRKLRAFGRIEAA